MVVIEKIKDMELLKAYYLKNHMNELFSKKRIDDLELFKVNRLEYICFQEEDMTYLWFLVEGRAKVIKTLANGKTLLLSFYEGFGVIGDVELVQEASVNCTVQALTTCYVLALPAQKARMLLKEDVKLLNFICRALAEKLENISNSSSINLLYPLENRLASYINMVAGESEYNIGRRCFNENLTQLAEALGTSYRHLLRTLNGLCQLGVLGKEKEGYIIMEEDKLEKLGNSLY